MEWLKARLVEKSTWAGIGVFFVAVLSALGIALPEGMDVNIKLALEAIGAVVGGFLVIKKTSQPETK